MNVLTIPTTRRIDLHRSFAPAVRPLVNQKKTSLEEKVTLLLTHDLVRLGWRLHSSMGKSFNLTAPGNYSKDVVKQTMAYARNAAIERNKKWIEEHIDLGRANLANGEDILLSEIRPRIEICETQEQNNLFRLFRYYWS